ncbi:MAG: hypothetical protein G01um101430_747 [Parcubacteria group bacterium Gr01-1014_30]|nr:MAG: hypothetical protein G01um101430_747 [Parcubacteria group bacterium Gr01-1014_30]
MNNTLNVPLSKKEQERLSRLALSYGFSLPEFSRRILSELLSKIPEESLDDYENPQELKASFQRALRDWRSGKVHTKL